MEIEAAHTEQATVDWGRIYSIIKVLECQVFFKTMNKDFSFVQKAKLIFCAAKPLRSERKFPRGSERR